MKLRIYTAAYRPFVMGGKVNYHIATEVSVTDAVDLGKGAVVRLALAPDGQIHVVEAETGAIIGQDLTEVERDVAEADAADITAQLVQARRDAETAETAPAEQFWARLSRAKPLPVSRP